MKDSGVLRRSSSPTMSRQKPKTSTLSLPVTLVTFVLISFRLSSLSYVASDPADIVHTFIDPILNVTPDKVQISTVKTVDLVIANLPTSSDRIFCAFSALGRTLITNATRKSYGVECVTPRTDLLPSIPQAEHYFMAELSVKLNANGTDLVTTNFTFFDCRSYRSCTQCVSSGFPCDWCVERLTCTYSASEDCHNGVLVNRVSRIGVTRLSGPAFCPVIFPRNSQEILISSGVRKAIVVKANIHMVLVLMTRFLCQFTIEGRYQSINGQLLADNMYCDAIEFSYTSRAPNITVPFAVAWAGGSKPLDNPDNIHIVVYKCRNMADSCGMCSILDEKYGCGWCQSSNSCEVREQCDGESSVWLNRDETCPNPEIHSFEPQLGPWEGGTNVTIKGINLGKSFTDIGGVQIAGLPCYTYPELYLPTREIVCRVDGPGTPPNQEGPVIVSIASLHYYSKLNFTFVDPVIESISPKYGPQSGGTLIRITGRHMNAASKIQASIDNLPCSIIRAEANETLCITSASDKKSSGILAMNFDNGIRVYDGVFEYVDDPTIEGVESGFEGQAKIPKGIPAGGLKVSVTGMNLGYIQNPQMYVYYDYQMFLSKCTISSNTNMICSSPTVEIPEDVVLDTDHPLSLEYGFLMDNVTGVQNLSAQGFDRFLLYPNPIYEEFHEGEKYYFGDYLTINGQNLDRACQESDVVVQIGNSLCNITSLSRHQLTCQPPLTQPSAVDSEGLITNHQELPEVVVVIGGVLRKSVGRLNYVSLTDLNTCLQQISFDRNIEL